MRERKKLRFTGYDYSTPGSYFVTICVRDHKCVLGEIKNGKIILNEYGSIVEKQWNWLFDRYNYTRKDEFIIIPDHFHGIIHIIGNENVLYIMSKNDDYTGNGRDNFVGNGNDHYIGDRNDHFVGNGRDNFVGNGYDHSPKNIRNHSTYNVGDNSMIERSTIKIKPLPELIGAFKTTSSKWIHRTGFIDFQWQKSYHDHIIRNTEELDRIREYINNNPLKWSMDSKNLPKKYLLIHL